tara:strand:- start:252 stop:536 length:285 start_codon:yes stop_codon:yes gene_type:complete
MTEWITVKDKKEDQIEKKVENEWIKKKIKPKEKESVWIKKKVKKELEEEKKQWITKKSDKKEDGPYITKKKVEEKASGGLIKGFPRLATKGFRR